MKNDDAKRIEKAANDSIAKMRLARVATRAAEGGILRGAAAADLQLLLSQVRVTHGAALTSARNLGTALAATRVDSITTSMHLAVKSVQEANTQADLLCSAPTQPQANTTREADYAAVNQLADLKAAFQDAPERHKKVIDDWIDFNNTAYRWAFGVGSAFLILAGITSWFIKHPLPGRPTALFLSCILCSFLSLLLGIIWRSEKQRLETSDQELQFEIDLLRYPVKVWEIRAEKTLLQNDRRLRRYYDQNLSENNKLFVIGVLCIFLGVAFLGLAFFAIYRQKTETVESKVIIATLGAVGSVLTNYVAAIYLKVHAAASTNLGRFHGRLVDTHQVLLANMIASRISDDNKRWDTFARIAENLAKQESKSAFKKVDEESKEHAKSPEGAGKTTTGE